MGVSMALEELLEWACDRPPWQQDALRRLALHGELTADDVAARAIGGGSPLVFTHRSGQPLHEKRLRQPVAREALPGSASGRM